MATIPMVNAQRNVTAGPSAEFMRGENLIPLQNLEKGIGAVRDVVSAFSAAHDLTQKNNAKNTHSILLGQIYSDALRDPRIKLDEKGLPIFSNNDIQYLARIKEAQSYALKGIDNQALANSLSGEMALDGFVIGQKITNDTRQKELKFADSETKKQFDILTAEMIQADQNGENGLRDQKLYQRNILVRDARMTGVWDSTREDKEQTLATQAIMRDKIYNDNSISEETSDLLAALNDHNKFTWLSLDQRNSFINELKMRIGRNFQSSKKAEVEAQLVGRMNVLKGLKDGTVDYNNPAQVTLISQQDSVMGEILINLKNNNGMYFPIGVKNYYTRTMDFVNSAKEIYSLKDDKVINSWLESALSKFGKNDVDVSKLGALAELAAGQRAANNPKPGDEKLIQTHLSVRDFLDIIPMMVPGLQSWALDKMMKRKYGLGLDGQQIPKETQKVIKETINEAYPSTLGLPGVPNKIMDGSGFLDSIYNGPNELDGEEHGPTTDEQPAELPEGSGGYIE